MRSARRALAFVVVTLAGCHAPLPVSWSERTTDDDRFHAVDQRADVRLCYRDYGPRDGLALVCVHGLGGNKAEFQALIPPLVEKYRLILVDLLGHGRSSAPPFWDYSPSQQARHVEDLLDALDVRDVVLVGTSYGGATSLELARQESNSGEARVRALVLIAPPAFQWPLTKRQRRLYELLVKPESERPFIVYLMSPRAIADRLIVRHSVSSPDFITPELLSDASYPFHSAATRVALLRTSRALLEWMAARTDGPKHYAGVRQPTLLIRGELDSLQPAEVVEQLAEHMPNATCRIIPGAGHVVDVERPELLAEMIEEWIQRSGAHQSER